MTVSLCCLQHWTVCKGDSDTDSFTACFIDHGVVSHHICCYDLWKQMNAGKPTVEHKLPFAPQCVVPTWKIFQSAAWGETFVDPSQRVPGMSSTLPAFKYGNFQMQSSFSHRFVEAVNEDEIIVMCIKSVVEEDCTVASYWTSSMKSLITPSYTWAFKEGSY